MMAALLPAERGASSAPLKSDVLQSEAVGGVQRYGRALTAEQGYAANADYQTGLGLAKQNGRVSRQWRHMI